MTKNGPIQALYNTRGCSHCTRTFIMMRYRPWWVRYVKRRQFSIPIFQIALRRLQPLTSAATSIAVEHIDNHLSMKPSFVLWGGLEHGVWCCRTWWILLMFCSVVIWGRMMKRANFFGHFGPMPSSPFQPPTSSTMTDEDESNDRNDKT